MVALVAKYGGKVYRMAAELSDRVCRIAEERGVSKSEVFERALDRGLEELWEDLVLARYFDDKLDREEVVERVDRAKVKRVERELEIVDNDIE